MVGQQGAHLSDGDFIQLPQPFFLRQSLADEHGVKAFKIGQDNELLQRSVVANVAFSVGMLVAPLFGGLAEEGDVEQVGFVGIDETGLGFGDRGRNERFFYGIGVDAVVDLCQRPLEVPIQLETFVLVVLESLEFFDKVELEFYGHPRGKLEGDVLVSVGAAVASRFRNQTNGTSRVDPTLGGENEAIQARLLFNPIEFDGIKTGVVELLPDAEELDGVTIPQPIGDEVVGSFSIFVTGDVGQGNEILLVLGKHGHGRALYCDATGFRFVHSSGTCIGFRSNSFDRVRIGQGFKGLEFERFNCGEYAVIRTGFLLFIRAES